MAITDKKSSFTCKLCNSYVSARRSYQLQRCQCKFCQKCIKAYAKSRILDNDYALQCPVTNCPNREFTLEDVKNLVDKNLFVLYIKFKTKFNLSSMKKLCINANCNNEVDIKINDSKETICPACNTVFCASCDQEWRPNHLCQNCPGCHVAMKKKKNNCSFTRCLECSNEFCWYCHVRIGPEYIIEPKHPRNCPNRNEVLRYAGFLIGCLYHVGVCIVAIFLCPFVSFYYVFKFIMNKLTL